MSIIIVKNDRKYITAVVIFILSFGCDHNYVFLNLHVHVAGCSGSCCLDPYSSLLDEVAPALCQVV